MALNGIMFQFPGLPNIHCLFSGRINSRDDRGLHPQFAGNISFQVGDCPADVAARREKLLDSMRPAGLKAWCECRQVHGSDILFDPPPCAMFSDKADLPEADGMMTCHEGVGLMIKTADCQPLLLAHRTGKYIMALHVGWRGNRNSFPFHAVRSFCGHYGMNARDVLAVRGPSLGPARAEFVNFEKEWGHEYADWFHAQSRCMDLWNLTKSQLHEAGIPEKQIYGIDICTADNGRAYFSYRRDRNTGRQASFIWRA